MFEGILEKILLAKLGKYIVGLDKDSLKVGVWGGDITLENVHLKANALLLLQLPFLITYGKIVKLVIKVPWSKLSSAPVEIRLEGLYVIISSQEKHQWEYSEEGDIINRKELIEAYEQRRKQLQDLKLLSAEEELKEKGFLEKLTAKVIDNLKFIIKDIHIRFENNLDGRIFAAGVTLEKIECFTTNNEWTSEFTDRHKAGFANLCILKLLNVISLGLYWKTGEESFDVENDDEITSKMKELISERDSYDYLITPINAQAKIIHNNDLINFEIPQYLLSIDLPEITVIYKQLNFHDTVKMFEYFAEYQQFLLKIENRRKFQMMMPIDRSAKNKWKGAIKCIISTIRHRKDRLINHFIPSAEIRKYYEENFKMLHRKLKKTGKCEDEALYNRIILLTKIENLYTWASHVQSVLEKEAKIPEKKPTGFSSLKFWGKKTVEPTVQVSNEESYEKIFSEIEAIPLPQYTLLPKSYVRIQISLNLGSGVFKLVKTAHLGEESLIFTYTKLLTSASFKVRGLDIDLTMQDLSLSSYSSGVFKTIVKKVDCEEPFWKLNFSAQPNNLLAWRLENSFQSLEIDYSLAFLNVVMSFFVVPKTQDSAKIAAWDTIKGIQDSTSEALSDLLHGESLYELKIYSAAPKIRLESPTKQGEFFLSLGDILVQSISTDDHYEDFQVHLSSLGLKYKNLSGNIIDVVTEFEISSLAKILKSKYKIKPKQPEPEIIIESNLPILEMFWNASIYHQLQRLPELFAYEQPIQTLSSPECKLKGKVQKLTTGLHAWKDCNAALASSYLYFFNSEHFGGGSSSFFYIKDCSIDDASAELGKKFCLRLHNIYGECIFALSSKKELEKWKYVLNETINEYESRTNLASNKIKKSSETLLLKFSFNAPKTIIHLTNDQNQTTAEISISGMQSSIIVRDDEYNFDGTLRHMEISEGTNSRFSKLFTSKDSKDLIIVKLQHINPKSINYQGIDFVMRVKCGEVEINWNHALMVEVLNFFQFAEYSDPTSLIEEKVGIVDKDHILLDFYIDIEDVTMFLNNNKTQVTIAGISVKKFSSNFLVQNEGYIWKGTLGNLEICELTNYPATALGNEFVPFQLFSVQNNSSLMKFMIIIYSDKNKDRDQDVSSKVELVLSSVSIVYLHQPIMRIVDYLNYHVLGAFDTQSRARDIDERSMIKPKIIEEKLSFTSIFVKIQNPIVVIPPRPGYESFFTLNLGDITIKNHLEKTNNPGWVDTYVIQMDKVNILSTTDQIAEEFDIKIEIKRKILMTKHLEIPNLDKAYRIFGTISEIKMNLSQRDYNLIIRTADLNILYDDQLESYISPSYKYQEHTLGEFITADFSIDLISILFTLEKKPIFELLCLKNSIKIIKYNDTTIEFNLKAPKAIGLIGENSVTSKDPNFNHMADEVFAISYDSLCDFYEYSELCRLKYILFGPVLNDHDTILNVHLKTDLESTKNIKVDIGYIRINFHLSMFYQILAYVTAGIPNYSASIEDPQDYLKRYRPREDMLESGILGKYFAPKIVATCNLTKSFVVLPSFRKLRTLVAYADLNFVYVREKEDMEGPDVVKRLILEKFQIFHSKYEELLNYLGMQPKRKVLEPLQFIYETKEMKKNHMVTDNYVIGSLNCALSYRDLLLIQSSYRFQEEMLNKDNSLIKILEGFTNLQAVEDKMRRNSSSSIMDFFINDTKTFYSFAGLNIILINDALTAYTPILDFSITIGDKALSHSLIKGESSFNGTLQIWSNYYNPIADVWEPFIENFLLEIEILSNKASNIKSQYVLSVASEYLNVNFSEVMVKNFQDILAVWDSNSSECSEVVSHFQIKNEVGYSILVQYKYSNDVTIVDSGNTADHIIDYYSREKNLWKSDSITVSIYPGDFQPPELRIKTNKVHSSVYHSGIHYTVVDVELKDTRKTLCVRSPVVIENLTEFGLKLIFYKPKKTENRECLPGKICPVPYDFILGSMAVEINEFRSRSLINLEDLWKKNKSNSTEIIVGSIHISLFYKISKTNIKKRSIFIKPTLVILNGLPCSIGLRIYDGKPSKFEELEIKQGNKTKNYSYSQTANLSFSLSLEGYSRSNISPLLNSQHSTNKIKLVDRKQQELTIFIHRIQDGTNTFMFYVFQVFINNSLNPIAFYHKQKTSEKLLPGQNFISTVLPSNKIKKIVIGLGNAKSKTVKIDTVGIQDIIELIGDPTPSGLSAKYQYTLDVQITKVIHNETVFTKIVIISPRYILVNNMQNNLVIAQEGLLQYGMIIQPGSRVPFHWTDKDYKELIRVKGKGEEWAWSGPFAIDNIGSFTIQSKNKSEMSVFLMIKVEIKIISTTAHVVLEEEIMSQASYRLENDSSIFSLAIYQVSSPEDTRFIDSMSSCLFTWSNYMLPHEVIVEFLIGKNANESKDTNSMYKINFDKLNQVLRIRVKDAPKDFDVIYASVYNEGPSRVLKFSDLPLRNMKDGADEILAYYSLTIPKLGVSIIEHYKHKSKEVFYLTFSQVVFLAESTKKQLKTELMIKDIQGDNQMSPDAIFPVFLHVAEISERSVLHMCAVMNKEVGANCMNFETFEFLLQTLCLKIDTVCVRKILEIANRLILKENSLEDLFGLVKEFNDPFNKTEINLNFSKTYYFSFLKIHPFKIIVSHVPLKDDSNKEDILSGIASFGMALAVIEAAPVKLYSIQLSDVFASETRLIESFKSHYKSQLMNEFYTLIGHSNILGNPIGLLNDLGTGMVDFFYEPAQGMVNGPISATEGFLKGTQSLVKNTVTGTFGTVSRITSTLTNGLAVLTQDQDYIIERQRDMAKNKPSNLISGVGLGMLSFIKNVGQGITGIVTEPIKGFKKNKMGGMVKGGLKGIGGLVVKPLTGALDMVSKSAEGIKNTASMFDETTEYIKSRYPRAIYGSSHLIQVYNSEDSELIDLLFRIKKNKYLEKEFLEQIYGNDINGKNVIVCFFTDMVLYINYDKERILWKIKYENIISAETIKGVFLIKIKKKKKEIGYKVEFKNSDNIIATEKKLLRLIEPHRIR
ncbi:hypothetical protein SteCoe_12834 [Stentor coeruleus]|uniref:PH domain-containing protein n=1 Tax=Stentor coeruleus TaxID=5963 RepID=A0A1R2C9S3_9CILI|nr:hypothetical protein SteCoe_12834 [Stentor coeruleus]